MKENRALAISSMLLAGLCYSIMLSLTKYSSISVPVPQIAFARIFINLIVITVIMWRFRISFLGTRRWLLFFRGASGAIALGLCFYATSQIPLVDMSIIVKMSVIFTALFASLWLREKLSLLLIIHIFLAFVGVSLIIKPSWVVTNIGGLAALTGAFLIGITGTLIRKLHSDEHPFTIIFYFSFVGSLLYLTPYGSSFILPNMTDTLAILGLSISGTIGQFGFTYAYRYAPASVITPYIYSEVVFSAFFGMYFFSEYPDLLTIIGTCLVIYCGIAIGLKGKAPTTSQEE